MAFNIIEASKKISFKYKRYLKTMFDIKDSDYNKIFNRKIEENKTFEKGPYLDVTDSFEKGRSIAELINDPKVNLSKDFVKIPKLYKLPSLHKHQEESLLKAIDGNNLIVSTGTGSGKTESFMLPIINELMKEKEINGTISDGVRALLIFPMNALANDQLDRLRKMFIDYPEITFGSYTGQTPDYDKTITKNGKKIIGGEELYLNLNENRDDEPRLRKPLKNEKLSRESMKAKPPHILITNYAMLEYLMIRPEDSVFFEGEKATHWKFIVLDEAHTYTGSTGIEVSMLLRRLNAKLQSPKIQYILTSATLGDEKSNKDVVKFAQNLCSAEFKEQNIIRASRIKLSPQDEANMKQLDTEFYNYAASLLDYEDSYAIDLINEKYNFGLKTDNLNEFLYDILINDETYWKVKRYLSVPKDVRDISQYMEWTDVELTNFVEVASRASKNMAKLFDSRYHMFIRATEGVFITLAPHKDLFLTRKNIVYDKDEAYKVFEVVTCTSCHALYILGNIVDNHIEQKASYDPTDIKQAFLIGDTITDDDEDNTFEDEKLKYTAYELCPHCGFVREASDVHKHDTSCGHDEKHFVKIYKLQTTNENGKITKCLSCGSKHPVSILRGFFTGQESTTSVIGTALFEELPSHIKKVYRHIDSDDDFEFELETDDCSENKVEEFNKAKQFIAFSDSRQAAAYYASYFSLSYDEILYRRIINEVLNCIDVDSISITEFVNRLTSVLKDKQIMPFDKYLELDKFGNLNQFDYNNLAWEIIIKEIVDSSSRTSLSGLGLVEFNLDNIHFGAYSPYNLSANEMKEICVIFTLGMMADGAIHEPKSGVNREFFSFNGIETSYELEIKGNYIKTFIPTKNNMINRRFEFVQKILKSKGFDLSYDEIISFLGKIWNNFYVPSTVKTHICVKNGKKQNQVNVKNFIIKKPNKIYICNKCKKVHYHNINDVCPTYKCDGKLVEFDINSLKNNHYYRMYNDSEIETLRIVEHTAQLNKEEAYNYQNLFKDQKIDVLSCSTTFEMGVDVGDLETVFMRNMPPLPSNYAQRAGRAGRSSTSAAFALTFCNKSNHDFSYFDNPVNMIKGNILPPQFNVENEKIAIRHLYSSVLSFFFNKYPVYFETAKEMMETDPTGLSGYKVLKDYLETKPQEILDYLINSLPEVLIEKFGVKNFQWIDYLFGNVNSQYPNLKHVRDVYLSDLTALRTERDNAQQNGEGYLLEALKKRIANYTDERITSFLSRNNILPRYGFPVDTVELYPNDKSKDTELTGLQLSRDLSVAISEYAPGCEIVAKNKLITSRYIKKVPGKDLKYYDYIECPHCKTLNVEIHKEYSAEDINPFLKCKHCNQDMDVRHVKTFLIPEFGFIAEENVRKPSMIKPEKTFRTEASFVNYSKDSVIKNEYTLGSIGVTIEQMHNDGEMAILNTQDFLKCPHCDYTIEAPNSISEFVKIIDVKKQLPKHNNSKGYPCKNTRFDRYSLGYQYKTDVIRLTIDSPLLSSDKYKEAYSILQAIILSAADTLNIEHTEIAGCLQYFNTQDGINYSYILYDKTPGGAGHVKRINEEKVLYQILLNAYLKSVNCDCASDTSCYKCLRTYQNQKHHDDIKREYVVSYLGQVLEGYNDSMLESTLEADFLNKLLNKADNYSIEVGDKNIYTAKFGNEEWIIEPQVELDIRHNVIQKTIPDFMMYPKNTDTSKLPLAIYVDGFQFHNDKVDGDSLKRDAIIYSGNYRIWVLGWHDVNETTDKEYTINILDDAVKDKDKSLINKHNSFNMLLEYLTCTDSESMYKSIANEVVKNISIFFGDDEISYQEWLNEIIKLNPQINMFDVNNIADSFGKIVPYIGCHFQASLSRKDNQYYVISYLDDEIKNRSKNFQADWYGYWFFNNVMQFADNFIAVTEKGINQDIYAILSHVKKTKELDLGDWETYFKYVESDTQDFIVACCKDNIRVADDCGIDLADGALADLVWNDPNIVYLAASQIGYKKSFEDEGYIVVTNVDELKKVI